MSEQYDTLIHHLKPLLKRVRTDVSAIKVADGSSRWLREPLTKDRMARHLNGGPARGVCPIKEGESVTMVGLYDLDSHGGETTWAEMVVVARTLMDALELDGNHPIAFRSSGGKGIHIYLLWADPQDAYSVRAYMTDVLHMLGYRNGAKGVVNQQIEVFPKQDDVPVGEFGNQFILPLAGKSEPLDPLLDLMPMGRDWIAQVQWLDSPPVERRERPVVASGAGVEGVEPIDRVRAALAAIPNDGGPDSPDYDRWRDLAFAVHEATGGSDEGREAFAEWSAQNPIFDAKFFEQRVWAYIKPAENRARGITRGTLFAEAGRGGWVDAVGIDAEGFEDVADEDVAQVTGLVEQRALEKYEAKADWKKAIEESLDEFTLRERVCAKIARDKQLNDIDRELLAEALKVRFAAIGAKLPIAACRKLIAPVKVKKADSGLPEWLEGWVYVTDADHFYKQDTEERLSMQGFNAKYNRMLPPAEEGEFRRAASWVALEDYQIETVTREVYLPWADSVFVMDGVRCVNAFRQSSMPTAAAKFTPEGRKLIERVSRHVLLLCGGRDDVADVLLSWMAFNVQQPGRKVRWAPLIKGIQGDGKTLIGRVMQAALGQSNVKDISPKVLGTDFTGWAQGACVGVLEEIRLTGHSRHDIYNALKPYVTNNSVTIHAKGRDEYNTINTMNYIAFTNHSDALPLDDSDRRFFIVFSPFLEKDDLQKAVGDVGAYFDALYDGIESHQAELRKWLLEYRVSESFKPNGTAPMTREKGSMIALGTSAEEEAARAVIQAGGVGIGASVLVSQYLTRAIHEVDPEIVLKTSEVSRLLTKLGWEKAPKPIKWQGSTCRVWVKQVTSSEPEVLRAALDATLVTSGGEGVELTPF